MWGDRPDSATSRLHAEVTALRQQVRTAGHSVDGHIAAAENSYVRRISRDALDLDRFTLLFRQGHAALDAEDHDAAEHLLGEARRIWRGPAGAGRLSYGWLRRQLDAVNALRIALLPSKLRSPWDRIESTSEPCRPEEPS
jgi:hypothetical protein